MTEQHEDEDEDSSDFWDDYDYCYECTGLPEQTRLVG